MALIWAEPFDQYGGNSAIVIQNGYSAVNISSFQAGRTGANSVQLFSSLISRPLSVPVATLGQGAAFNFQSCGGNNVGNVGLLFASAGFTFEATVSVMPDLSLGVWDRTFTLKGQTPPHVLVGGSWVWVEAKLIGNVGGVINTGSIEVRVNGITKVTVNGLNLPNLIAFSVLGGSTNSNCFFDDWIVWDTTGTKNNDFMGDRALYMSVPNTNVAAHQDFVPSAGNAFSCVNLVPPVDTTFIEGNAAGNISEFTKGAIGIASTDIAAVVVMGRLFKSDAGAATGRVGINSVGNVLNSPSITPGTTGAFFTEIVELDPNGNIPWTKAAADAANIRITRDT